MEGHCKGTFHGTPCYSGTMGPQLPTPASLCYSTMGANLAPGKTVLLNGYSEPPSPLCYHRNIRYCEKFPKCSKWAQYIGPQNRGLAATCRDLIDCHACISHYPLSPPALILLVHPQFWPSHMCCHESMHEQNHIRAPSTCVKHVRQAINDAQSPQTQDRGRKEGEDEAQSNGSEGLR